MRVSAPIVALSITLGGLALALGYTHQLAGWRALALDSLTIAVLICHLLSRLRDSLRLIPTANDPRRT